MSSSLALFSRPGNAFGGQRSYGGLLATVTSSLAAIAVNMAIKVLTRHRADFLRTHNLFFIDLETYTIEGLAVERRKGCDICG